MYRFNINELEVKKNIARLSFIRSKNSFKTILWIIKENPGFLNKNICIFTLKLKPKLEKMLKIQKIKEKIQGNIVICSEIVENTVFDI